MCCPGSCAPRSGASGRARGWMGRPCWSRLQGRRSGFHRALCTYGFQSVASVLRTGCLSLGGLCPRTPLQCIVFCQAHVPCCEVASRLRIRPARLLCQPAAMCEGRLAPVCMRARGRTSLCMHVSQVWVAPDLPIPKLGSDPMYRDLLQIGIACVELEPKRPSYGITEGDITEKSN